MNIFLDSNVLYKDPFLEKGYNKTLNRLAKHEDVKLFISKTVYMEVLRGHKDFLEEQLKAANNALKKLIPYLDEERQKFIFDVNLEDLLEDFKNKYDALQNEQKLEIIDFDGDVLEHIVEIDMYEKNPFIKQQEIVNKGGETVRYSKKEIRDAIIWYSYQVFIKKNNLENCYFISNNTNEFGDIGAKKSPENQPYSLHPELSKKNNIIAYKTVKGFLAHNDQQVKELFKDIHTQILSEELYEKIKEELEDGLAAELVNKFFTEQIFSYTFDFLSNKQPENIHPDYFMGGYVDPSMDGIITGIRLNEVEVFGDEITVAVDVDVEMEVEIYLYNPVYDDKDERYQYYGTDTVKVVESAVFVIPVETEKELDEENFSLRDYIEDTEPDNLNIEVIEYSNINHTDMFTEEYEYEDELIK